MPQEIIPFEAFSVGLDDDEEERRRRSRLGLGRIGSSVLGGLAGLGSFTTDVGAGLAGLGNVLLPGQPLEGIQTALSERTRELGDIAGGEGLAGQIGFGVGRLAGEVAGVGLGGGAIRGASTAARGTRLAPVLGRLARPVAPNTVGQVGTELTGLGALLSGTPSASIQALGGEEASTAGAIASLTPESGVGRLAAEVAENPSLRVATEAGLDVLLGGALEGVGRAVGSVARRARAPRAAVDPAAVEVDEVRRFAAGELENNRPVGEVNSKEAADEQLRDLLGDGAVTVTNPELTGTVDPRGYKVQFNRFGADEKLQQEVFTRYEQLLREGQIDPKRTISFEEHGEIAKQFGFDEVVDAAGAGRLDPVMMEALKETYNLNFRRLAQIADDTKRLMQEQLNHPQGSPEWNQIADHLDQLQHNTALFELQNDTLLKIYVPNASQAGRDLALLKRMAAERTDNPLFWQTKMMRLAGGRDLNSIEAGRLAAGLEALRAGDETELLELAADIAPKIQTFRFRKGGLHMIGHPLITTGVGAAVGSQYEENPLAGALAGAYGGLWLSLTGDALVQMRRAGLLTGGRTQARNFLSNTTEALLRHVESPAAVVGDKIASSLVADLSQGRVVNQRTRAFAPRQRLRAGIDGANRGVDKLVSVVKAVLDGDADTAQRLLMTGPEADRDFLKRLDLIARGRNAFENPQLNSVVNGIFALQGAADAPFRFAAFYESLWEQASLAARNIKDPALREAQTRMLLENPDATMLAVARFTADEATFRSQSRLAAWASDFDRRFGGNSITDRILRVGAGLVLPFRGTPANVLTRLLQRAPITGQIDLASKVVDLFQLAKIDDTSVKHLRELAQAQRRVSDAVGRNVSGLTLTMLGGYVLAQRGIMSGSLPTDPTEREKWQQQGKTPDSILLDLGDGLKWHRLTGISPFGNLLAMGATLHHDMNDPNNETFGEVASDAAVGAARAFLEQSFLRGVSEPLVALSEGRGGAAAAGSFTGSFVPTVVADIATLPDPVLRQDRGPLRGIMNRLPGVRSALPARQDELGEEITFFDTTPEGVLRMVNPFLSREQPQDRVSVELRAADARLPTARQGEEEDNGTFERRMRIEGTALRGALESMFDDPRYRELDQEQQQEAISQLSRNVRSWIRDNDLRTKEVWGQEIFRAIRTARRQD